jgi:hypothetical protein
MGKLIPMKTSAGGLILMMIHGDRETAKSVLSLLYDSAKDDAEKRSSVFDDGRLLPLAEPLRAFRLQRPETLSALPQGW